MRFAAATSEREVQSLSEVNARRSLAALPGFQEAERIRVRRRWTLAPGSSSHEPLKGPSTPAETHLEPGDYCGCPRRRWQPEGRLEDALYQWSYWLPCKSEGGFLP